MTADFTLKRNDTKPYLKATLEDQNGAIDLTNATKVKLLMKHEEETVVSGECEITEKAAGKVQYKWIAANTEKAGVFNLEFEITWNDSTVQTVPNNAYKQVEVFADLG